jgi:hypothetical protein
MWVVYVYSKMCRFHLNKSRYPRHTTNFWMSRTGSLCLSYLCCMLVMSIHIISPMEDLVCVVFNNHTCRVCFYVRPVCPICFVICFQISIIYCLYHTKPTYFCQLSKLSLYSHCFSTQPSPIIFQNTLS